MTTRAHQSINVENRATPNLAETASLLTTHPSITCPPDTLIRTITYNIHIPIRSSLLRRGGRFLHLASTDGTVVVVDMVVVLRGGVRQEVQYTPTRLLGGRSIRRL